jgi:hypothetical protein
LGFSRGERRFVFRRNGTRTRRDCCLNGVEASASGGKSLLRCGLRCGCDSNVGINRVGINGGLRWAGTSRASAGYGANRATHNPANNRTFKSLLKQISEIEFVLDADIHLTRLGKGRTRR